MKPSFKSKLTLEMIQSCLKVNHPGGRYMLMAVEEVKAWGARAMKELLEVTSLCARAQARPTISYMPAMSNIRLPCFSSWSMLKVKVIDVMKFIVIPFQLIYQQKWRKLQRYFRSRLYL